MPRLAVGYFDVASRKRGKNNKTAGFYPIGRRDVRLAAGVQQRGGGARNSKRRRTRTLYARAAGVKVADKRANLRLHGGVLQYRLPLRKRGRKQQRFGRSN